MSYNRDDNIWEFIMNMQDKAIRLVDTVATYNLNKSKMVLEQDMINARLDKKLVADENKQNLNFQKEVHKGAFSANQTRIDNLVDEFEEYGALATDFVNIENLSEGKFSTPDGEKAFSEIGMDINSDFVVSYDIDGNLRQNIQSLNDATIFQDSIIDKLNSELDVLRGLKDHRKNVDWSSGFDALDQVHDISDDLQYMYDNPDIFGHILPQAVTGMSLASSEFATSIPNPQFKYNAIYNESDPIKRQELLDNENLTEETLLQLKTAYDNAAPIRSAFEHLGLQNHSQMLRDQSVMNNLIISGNEEEADKIGDKIKGFQEEHNTDWRRGISSILQIEGDYLGSDDEYIKAIGGNLKYIKGDMDDINTVAGSQASFEELTLKIGKGIEWMTQEDWWLVGGGSHEWFQENFKGFENKSVGEQQLLVLELAQRIMPQGNQKQGQGGFLGGESSMVNTAPISFIGDNQQNDEVIQLFIESKYKDTFAGTQQTGFDFSNFLQGVNAVASRNNKQLPPQGDMSDSQYLTSLLAIPESNQYIRQVLADTYTAPQIPWGDTGLDLGKQGLTWDAEAGDYTVGSKGEYRTKHMNNMINSWLTALQNPNPDMGVNVIAPEMINYFLGIY